MQFAEEVDLPRAPQADRILMRSAVSRSGRTWRTRTAIGGRHADLRKEIRALDAVQRLVLRDAQRRDAQVAIARERQLHHALEARILDEVAPADVDGIGRTGRVLVGRPGGIRRSDWRCRSLVSGLQ